MYSCILTQESFASILLDVQLSSATGVMRQPSTGRTFSSSFTKSFNDLLIDVQFSFSTEDKERFS